MADTVGKMGAKLPQLIACHGLDPARRRRLGATPEVSDQEVNGKPESPVFAHRVGNEGRPGNPAETFDGQFRSRRNR